MTTHTTRRLPNGDIMEVHTNPGASPRVIINGVIQPRDLYKIVFGKDGLPYAVKKKPRAWKAWFAWRPVTTISGNRVWLKKIYRSRGNDYVDHDDWTWYYYADIFEVMQDVDNENY